MVKNDSCVRAKINEWTDWTSVSTHKKILKALKSEYVDGIATILSFRTEARGTSIASLPSTFGTPCLRAGSTP